MAEAEDKVAPEYSQKWWCARIEEREKELKDKWWTYADAIVDRYLDIRDEGTESAQSKYNIFWANTHIFKSALYASPPKPAVTRQNGDAKDDVARTAALMLQRMLHIGVNKDASEMHAAFKHGVEDRLIPGMGQVWLRYEVETSVQTVPGMPANEYGPAVPPREEERIVAEFAPCDYVHWRDFLWSPARTWEEVWWVGRRVWMKKKRFIKRFKKEKYDQLKGNYDNATTKTGDNGLPKGFSRGRIEVFEIWCEDTNKVYFINKYADEILEEAVDPLKLDDFFPCPKPLIATHTTNNFMPRADYTMIRDQYAELDTLNDRISILTKALRVVGVFDKDTPELGRIITGSEFDMIAVDKWAAFAEKGGMKGVVDWFPVDVIAKVLGELTMQRQAVIGQIYELTSISDIMRGASNARETAKAQTLKAQYSSVALKLTQQDVARWVAHAMKIKAEIIGRHFQPKTIIEQSQIMFTESGKFAEQAVQLIKNFRASEYRIEVSEESLSIADYNAERELRTEYLTAVGQFLAQAGTVLEIAPDAMPYMLRMVQWVTASFRGGTDIESVLDEAVAAASAPKPPAPDPEAAKEAAKLQAAQQEAQLKGIIAKGQAESNERIAAAELASEERIAAAKNDTTILVEEMRKELKLALEAAGAQAENNRAMMEQMLERMRLAHDAIQGALGRKHDLEVIEQTPAPGNGD